MLCEYCNYGMVMCGGDNNLFAVIEGDVLQIHSWEKDEWTGEYIHGVKRMRAVGLKINKQKINYCPMCGRKL